jgi:hypothetical protein
MICSVGKCGMETTCNNKYWTLHCVQCTHSELRTHETVSTDSRKGNKSHVQKEGLRTDKVVFKYAEFS